MLFNKKLIINLAYWLFVLALAVTVRLWDIDHYSLRLDEAQSIWQASHSLEFIKAYMLKNVHLPLHNSLLHLWLQYFGSSETSVRLLAFIPGFLAVPALYFLSAELIGKERSKLTLLFGALSPIWVWYSREIRMYTLLVLMSILSYLFFVKAFKYGRAKYFVAYTVVNILGMYTHYFFGLALFVQAAYYLLTVLVKKVRWNSLGRAAKRRQFVYFILSAGGLAAAFLPWVMALYKNYGSGTLAPSLVEPTAFNIILSYFEFTNGFLPEHITGALIAFWPIIILMGFVYLAKRQNPFSPGILLVIIGAFLPVYIVYQVSVAIRPVYLTRYLILVTPMYYILLAWYFGEVKGRLKLILLSVFLLSVLSALYIQATHYETPVNENYRDAVNYIEESAAARDVVIVAPPYTIYPFQYYYDGEPRVYTMPIWDKKKGAIPEITEERLKTDATFVQKSHKSMFVLLTMDLDGAKEVKDYFDNHYTKLDKKQFSKYIFVEVYQAEYL